jgi:hypothetical protein
MPCHLVDHAGLLDPELVASFEGLPPDEYLRGERCFRHRAYGRARISGAGLSWSASTRFHQSAAINGYAGGIERRFAPLANPVRVFALRLLTDLRVRGVAGREATEIGCHQIRIVADESLIGHPTPEGPHQDGFARVAITCIGTHNVRGAQTVVSLVDREDVIFDRALLPGETVILDDRRVKHYVTPITPRLPGRAHRDVVVVTLSEPE